MDGLSYAAEPDRPDPLEGLNDAQRSAVTHTGSPLIVLAGPGTGKTRVIVSRIAHMVGDLGVDPSSVLALTFTNKAAGEMRERLALMLGPVAAEAVQAFTFNGFGAHVLRRFGDLAGLGPGPELLDSAQRKRMLRRVVDERALFRGAVASGLETAVRNAGTRIDAMHAAGFTAETARARLAVVEQEIRDELAGDPSPEIAETLRARVHELGAMRETVELWEGFDAACLEAGVMGFDHQIAWTNRLLATSDMARDLVRDDHRHVVVDEYQDVNAAQIELLRLVAPPDRHTSGGDGPDLCVVGDDDQAIYGFRGSDDRAFLHFEKIWTSATTVMLEENYRSATPVLERAAAVIERAHDRFRPDKVVRRPDGAAGEPAGAGVEAVRLAHYKQADEVIASMVRAGLATYPDVPPCEYAVIVRTGNEGDRIRRSLELEGIRAQARRSVAPTADDGVLDVLAWIDLLLHPRRTWSPRRVMLRPPFQMDVATVTAIESRYAAVKADAERSRRRGETAEDPPVYRARLASLLGMSGGAQREEIGQEIDAGQTAILRRVLALWDELAGPAQTASAVSVIGEIVRRTDVVHNELLDGRARAERVSAVVGMIRFAAERAERLEQPGDLRAFMAYYEDLDEAEQTLRQGTVANESEDDSGVDREAVQILTAHGSKGLEFDTVFLPRVESQHGFPAKPWTSDEERLPGWMLEDDGRAETQRHDDEERRLFYVACTRAERRLVIMGRVPKSKPSGTNYLWELLDEPGRAVVREAGEVLGPHPRDDAERELTGWELQSRRRDAVRAARRIARLEAAAALEAAGSAERVEAAEARLAACARRMAVIAAAEAGDGCPAWVEDTELRGLHGTLISEAPEVANATAADVMIRRMPGPLRLSYTAIKSWHDCARCYFVREVLGVPERETQQIVTGTVVHEALERFYRPLVEAKLNDRPEPEMPLDELLRLGEEAFEGARRKNDPADDGQRERVAAMLEQYYERMHPGSGDTAHVEQSITFEYAHRGAHRIKAKIDRIDFDGAAYRIIDYKTGHARKDLLDPGGKDHQLGIYLMALRAWLNDSRLEDAPVPVGSAAYWILSTGDRGEVSFDAIAKEEAKTRKWIEKAIDGMLDGEFPKGRQCNGLCDLLEPGCGA